MRTFHIGGTASRVSEQSTLDAKHAGTVRYQGLQVVEAKGEGRATPGELIVMNRTGSLVVQDDKGRDRERYPIVYGARLKVRDGQAVEQGQILVEWDPYTFSILTEDAGTVRFKDIIDGVTVHEEVDEVTGLSRKIIVDSPDEKKQPTIEIRDKAARSTRKLPHAVARAPDGRGRRDGRTPATCSRRSRARRPRPRTSPAVCRAWSSCSRRASRARRPSSRRSTASSSTAASSRGSARSSSCPDDGGEPREYSLPRGVHVNVQEGERVRAGEPLMDGPSNPHDILSVLGEKALQRTWSTRSRRSTGCRASTSTTSTSRSSSGR